MAEEERIVTVRGEGGLIFDVDLAKNPWAQEQLSTKQLALIAGPKTQPDAADEKSDEATPEESPAPEAQPDASKARRGRARVAETAQNAVTKSSESDTEIVTQEV